VWSYEDAKIAVACETLGLPYVCGPNVLFNNSRKPGFTPDERELLGGKNCVLAFTESAWYAELIRESCPTQPGLPIAIFRYPIDPPVPEPKRIEWDVLLYLKDNRLANAVLDMKDLPWKKSKIIVYGRYERKELIYTAQRSRCCLYVCTDDRGPLGAAEIALAGCPLVGIERGCPWVTNPAIGVRLTTFHREQVIAGYLRAIKMRRGEVKAAAEEFFSTAATVRTILEYLEKISEGYLDATYR
jgi:hypothetical protein